MRLGQLARHLRISQKEITDYLDSQSISIGEGSNAKIEAELEYQIINHFNPELLATTEEEQLPEAPSENLEIESSKPETLEEDKEEEVIELEIEEEQEVINESSEEIPIQTDSQIEKSIDEVVPEDDNVAEESSSEPDEESEIGSLSYEDTSGEDNIEVIRVKKVKLEGIKVVGKIDLPEPKVKEPTETEDPESEVEDKKEDRPPRKSRQYHGKKRKGRNYGKRDRRESYEQRIAREKREAEREKLKLEKEAKARKKLHYVENVQAHVQIKPSKKAKKKEKLAQKQQAVIEKPKNPVKRFWGWLNGKYDNY